MNSNNDENIKSLNSLVRKYMFLTLVFSLIIFALGNLNAECQEELYQTMQYSVKESNELEAN